MLAHPGTGRKEVLVERFSFSSDVAFVPRGDLLDRVTVAPLTPSLFEGSPMQAATFRFAPGGRLLRPSAYDPMSLPADRDVARATDAITNRIERLRELAQEESSGLVVESTGLAV